MRCLTDSESQRWFAAMDVKTGAHRRILFPQPAPKRMCVFVSSLQIEASDVTRFCTELVDWLPNGCERILWLRNWETYPPDQTFLFEAVRRGCKEGRRLIEAPGHLFESSKYDRRDYDTRTGRDHEENALMWGLLLLMIVLNWDGYLVAPTGECIELDDNSLAISSENEAKLAEAHALVERFKLKFKERAA
jgi:hypothetical protein